MRNFYDVVVVRGFKNIIEKYDVDNHHAFNRIEELIKNHFRIRFSIKLIVALEKVINYSMIV